MGPMQLWKAPVSGHVVGFRDSAGGDVGAAIVVVD